MIDVISKRRMEKNEAVFRAKNEEVTKNVRKLKKIAKNEGRTSYLGDLDSALLFYCECSDENCRERIEIKPAVYARIHAKRDNFTILPGHDVKKIERIIKKEKDYHIVQKFRTPEEKPDKLQPTEVDNS